MISVGGGRAGALCEVWSRPSTRSPALLFSWTAAHKSPYVALEPMEMSKVGPPSCLSSKQTVSEGGEGEDGGGGWMGLAGVSLDEKGGGGTRWEVGGLWAAAESFGGGR